MSLFDSEQIMKSFIRRERHDADRETAERMIKDGELSLEKIAHYVPSLSMNELRGLKAVMETIRICKNRNVLTEYLESKEQEVVDIMMTSFDDEPILEEYLDDEQVLEAYTKGIDDNATHRESRENARIMLKNGRITIEEIPSFFPKLTSEDTKELEAEVMQLA